MATMNSPSESEIRSTFARRIRMQTRSSPNPLSDISNIMGKVPSKKASPYMRSPGLLLANESPINAAPKGSTPKSLRVNLLSDRSPEQQINSTTKSTSPFSGPTEKDSIIASTPHTSPTTYSNVFKDLCLWRHQYSKHVFAFSLALYGVVLVPASSLFRLITSAVILALLGGFVYRNAMHVMVSVKGTNFSASTAFGMRRKSYLPREMLHTALENAADGVDVLCNSLIDLVQWSDVVSSSLAIGLLYIASFVSQFLYFHHIVLMVLSTCFVLYPLYVRHSSVVDAVLARGRAFVRDAAFSFAGNVKDRIRAAVEIQQ